MKPRPRLPQPSGGEYCIIPLTKGKVALVDPADYEAMSQFNWIAGWDPRAQTFYARRACRLSGGKRGTEHMHRQILNAPADLEVDHRDGDGLNNRRHNIRLATRADNRHNVPLRLDNTSGFKGVSFWKRNNTWKARIGVNGKSVWLGYFDTPEEAAAAYATAAVKFHGEFANLGKTGMEAEA